MLKATVLSGNLKTGLTHSFHAVSSRSQLPILLNFLLETKSGNLFVSSTDLEIGIVVKIPAKIEEEGAITVPAKTFLDLVTNIELEKIEISATETKLELKGEKLKTSFPTLPAQDFPKLYESKGEKQAEFSKTDFDKEISRIVFAAASDIGRPALSGILFKKEEKGLTLVATDGYRLSLKQGISSTQVKNSTVENLIIPARVIKELVGLKEENQKIELFVLPKSNQVLFEFGDITILGRLIEAEYPDYQKIIPQDHTTRAIFDKNEALNAVRACSVFAREAANIIKMTIGKDKITFSASASSAGENETEIDAKTEGEENEIAFNSRYLLEFFTNISDDQISFEMTGPLNPGVFKLVGNKDFLHLIMPIRVQG